MRIVFFGLPLAALLLAADGHSIELAVLARKDAVGRRRLARTIGPPRVHLRGALAEAELEARVAEARPDLLVSWFWTAKLPMRLVRLARLGGIGVHPSLLPRHRGPDPYFAAIDAGDRETGVTAHRIEAEYDTGAILGQKRLAIDPAWNAWRLARALDRPSLALLRELALRFDRGEHVRELAQDDSLATQAAEPDEEACALAFRWTTERLLCRIRALSPSPGAWTEIDERLVVVQKARAAATYPRALLPGEAAIVDGRAVVRTADGAIELLSGEIDDAPADARALASLVANARAKVIG